MKAEILISSHACLGEGAFFDEKNYRVLWLDIFGREVHILNPVNDTDICMNVEKPITTIVPDGDNFVVGAIDGVYRMSRDAKMLTPMPSPMLDYVHYRCNDGKCGPDGRLWVGIVENEGQRGLGGLYAVTDNSCELQLGGLDCPNGIVWNSRRDQVYFTDSMSGRIYAFDYVNGKLENKRDIFRTNKGYPDGMTIDTEDTIWAAIWGSGCVFRIDPISGKVIDIVETDAPNVSSVAIANKKIYITSATKDMDREMLLKYPLSGGLFAANVDAVGASYFHYGNA